MQVQIAEIYCSNMSNVSSHIYSVGRKSHKSYSEACNYLSDQGFSFSKETKSNSGGAMELWRKEVVTVEVVEEVQPTVTTKEEFCSNIWCEGQCETCNPSTITVVEVVATPVVETTSITANEPSNVCKNIWCEGTCQECKPVLNKQQKEIELLELLSELTCDAFKSPFNFDYQSSLLDKMVDLGLETFTVVERGISTAKSNGGSINRFTDYDIDRKHLVGNIRPEYVNYLIEKGYKCRVSKQELGVKYTNYSK